MSQTVQIFVVLVFIGGVVSLSFFAWQADKRQRNRTAKQPEKADEPTLSDDAVSKKQTEFDKRLLENVDQPDGIRWKDAFVYLNLMRKWYGRLVADIGYDETKFTRIKSDWLAYMELLEHKSRLSFLGAESPDKKAKDVYDEEWMIARSKVATIENGLAAQIGPAAIEELEKVRSRNYDAFDRSGQKPMAPVGYHYSPVSLEPYIEELRPDR